jgi:hypothetical protein
VSRERRCSALLSLTVALASRRMIKSSPAIAALTSGILPQSSEQLASLDIEKAKASAARSAVEAARLNAVAQASSSLPQDTSLHDRIGYFRTLGLLPPQTEVGGSAVTAGSASATF